MIPLVAFVLLAFILRVWQLGDQSLWYDEAFSVYVARADFTQAQALLLRDFHPPLYYALLRVAVALFGSSEFAVRFLSVLTGLPLVALMGALARRLFRRWQPAVLAGLLTAVAPMYVWYARETRMYSLVTTLGLGATYGLVRALKDGRRGGYATWVVCALAAVFTHYSALYLVFGLGLYWLTRMAWRSRRSRWRRREWLPGFVAWGIVASGVGVALWHLSSPQTAQGYWPGRLDVGRAAVEGLQVMVGGHTLSPAQAAPLVWLVGGLALVTALAGLSRAGQVTWLAVCAWLIPSLINLAVLVSRPKFEPRHLMVLSPSLWLLCAAGIWGLARISRRAGALAALMAGGGLLTGLLIADWNLLARPDYTRDDWRGAVQYVRASIAPDETLILVSGHAYPVLWYYGAPAWVALPPDDLLDVRHVLNYPVAQTLNQALQGKNGAWLIEWQSQVVDPTGIVPALLGDLGTARPDLPVFDGLRLRHYRFDRPARFPAVPDVSERWERPVAPALTFIGASLSPSPPAPADAPLEWRAFWQAADPLPFGYRVSLRLFDRQQIEYARADFDLAGPRYSTNLWATQEPVMGQYTLTLPLGTPPGLYTPTLTLYRGDERYDTLPLATLAITRPVAPPTVADLGLPAPDGGPQRAAPALTLTGVGFDQGTVTPCAAWSLSLAWRVEGAPADDYRLRLRAGPDQVETPLAPGYGTSRWQPGDVWRTRHTLNANCRALDGTFPVAAQLVTAEGEAAGAPVYLGDVTVVAGRSFDLPGDLTAATDIALADAGRLVGYRLAQEEIRPGETLSITLYWQSTQETGANYSVFVHLQSDRVWAQHDGWPANGAKPTSTWARNEIIADLHQIPIGPDVPPGSYQLVVGMYDAATLTPVAAWDAEGRPIPDGRIVLQTLNLP